MSKAFDDALIRAATGLDWSCPCLIWVADYLRAATGRDPAEDWRWAEWNELIARHELMKLAVGGQGDTAVERALDAIARRDGWRETDAAEQGGVMVGVYTAADDDSIGVPAIFDGWRGWLIAYRGAATILREPPKRMWVVA